MSYRHRNNWDVHFKGIDSIYVRVSHNHREVEFHETWDSASRKTGKKKKFLYKEGNLLINYIMKEWKDLTLSELDKWKSPEWLKEIKRKREKNRIDVTIKDGAFILKFESLHNPMIIRKNIVFYELYDRNWYLYEQIISIASAVGYEKVVVHTDIVDLLRINRIYWESNNVDVIVKVESEYKLRLGLN